MLTSLAYVVLVVRDLDQAAAAYETLLGRRSSWRGASPELGAENVIFRLANGALELSAPAGDGRGADGLRTQLDATGEGLLGLAFGTDDAEECCAALRARGLPAEAPRDGAARDASTGRERSWRNVVLPAGATGGTQLFTIEDTSAVDALPRAEPLGDPAAAIEALDHVVIETADLEAARTLYGDALGLRLALDRTFEARGLRILFFRVGGATIEVVGRLAAGADAPAPDASASSRARDRLGGLAWRTPDVDAARRRLAAAGADVSGVRPGFKPGTRVCTVRAGTCGVPTLLIGPG